MSKKRVLLVRPNSSIVSVPPPLGLMYIASYLKDKTDKYEIKILDARVKNLTLNEIRGHIEEYMPEYVGITGLHFDSAFLHQIAKISKSTAKNCRVIIGGPYATSDYEIALQDGNVDFCVVGEGEVVFRELLEALDGGEAGVDGVRGIAFSCRGEIVFTGRQELIEDLDVIPFPAWDLIGLDEYFYGGKRCLENPMQIHKEAVSILSSRGCPFGCSYCHNIFGRKFRARSPENVISEIKYVVENYGVKEIEFLDDTFNFDKKRVQEICGHIVKENIKLRICFSNGIRADFVDEHLIAQLKEAGTYRINYGIESASPRIQKIMGKGLNLDYARRMLAETCRQKIMCGAFFMLGFPTETEDEMRETINFAVKAKLHTAVFALVTPFPGTALYEMAKNKGYNVNKIFSSVAKISVNMSAVDDRKLEKLRITAYRRFYFNIIRCWRIFIRMPKKTDLIKNFGEVFRLVFFKKELYG